MANHKSAQKRIRQTAKRTARNKTIMTKVRTFVKRVETAIESGDQEAAKTAFAAAMPVMQSGVSKGVWNKNTCSRKLSRLSSAIKKLAA